MRHGYMISVSRIPKKTGFILFLMPVTIFCLLSATEVRAQQGGEQYTATNLVATIIGPADTADSSLVNPWGLASDPKGGPWWVADAGKGRSTAYGSTGLPFPGLAPIVVAIPLTPGDVSSYSEPTGIVHNSTGDFKISPSAVPSQFIFVTWDGSIAGWNGGVDRREAVLVIDNSPQAGYTGAAIASIDGQNVLLAANFGQRRVDAFGSDFGAYPLKESAFTDPLLPEVFSPFNVQTFNGKIWITFARIGTDGRASPGEGAGYVEAFDDKGNIIMQLENGPWLDAPWGIALAPDAGFGTYSGSLLVGNTGSGRIAAFDATSGHFLGFLKNEKNEPMVIPGLHGLGFGNGSLAGSTTTLYFTAGSTTGLNLVGSISQASVSGGAAAQY